MIADTVDSIGVTVNGASVPISISIGWKKGEKNRVAYDMQRFLRRGIDDGAAWKKTNSDYIIIIFSQRRTVGIGLKTATDKTSGGLPRVPVPVRSRCKDVK